MISFLLKKVFRIYIKKEEKKKLMNCIHIKLAANFRVQNKIYTYITKKLFYFCKKYFDFNQFNNRMRGKTNNNLILNYEKCNQSIMKI